MHGVMCQGSIATVQVLQGTNAPNDAVGFVRNALEQLHRSGIVATACFDGAARPYKEREHVERQQKLEAAKDLSQSDDATAADTTKAHKAAFAYPQLRHACIDMLKTLGILTIGAPFEADGQLAWAYKQGEIDAVLTIDGDRCALGCVVLRIPHGKTCSWVNDGSLEMYDICYGGLTPR
eukprot:6211760-Pleurochrysis_carterae.AAC.1